MDFASNICKISTDRVTECITNEKPFSSNKSLKLIIVIFQRPQLANFTDLIIPPALLFSDDHYDDFKIVGLKVLAHVVENCVRVKFFI